MSRKRKLAGIGRLLGVFLLLGCAAVGTGWTADGLIETLASAFPCAEQPADFCSLMACRKQGLTWTAETSSHLLWFLSGLLLLAGGVYGLFRLRHGIIFGRATMEHLEDYKGRAVLIMGLSPNSGASPDKALQDMDALTLEHLGWSAEETTRFLEASPSKNEAQHLTDVQKHPWRQNMRIVRAHLSPPAHGEPLAAILIIPSVVNASGKGSARDVITFTALLKRKLEGAGYPDIQVLVHEINGVEYENFSATAATLDRAVRRARHIIREKKRNPRSNICIDATAGQKVFSIAAATVTLNHDLIFSYVNNKGEVHFYDAQVHVLDAFE